MFTPRAQPCVLLLCSSAGRSVQPGINAPHRRAVSEDALLRVAQDDGGIAHAGLSREWQARATADAADGGAGHYSPETTDERAGASDLSLPVARSRDRTPESGVVCRYHVCADATWISL